MTDRPAFTLAALIRLSLGFAAWVREWVTERRKK